MSAVARAAASAALTRPGRRDLAPLPLDAGPLRVALVTYSTRPRGGVVHTLALAEAMAALGDDVTVFSVRRGGDRSFFRPVDPRVRVVLVDAAEADDIEGRVLASVDALAAAIDPAAFDVVHAQDCIAANAVPGCVRTVHHVDHFTSPVLVACHERAIVTPRAHVCVSAPVAQELADGWGIAARVIPNGVEAERFAAAAEPGARAARAAWRDRLGAAPFVLTVGGIEPRKGTLALLEACALAGVRLVVAGGETLFDYRDYRAAFDRRAATLGTPVEVLGPVDHDALPALVACADVFALASVREGFGLAAMEALAASVPVVLQEGPVLRRVFAGAALFGDGPSGLAAALTTALTDASATAAHPTGRQAPTAGTSRREAGRALAARHTWEAAALAHRELYAEIVGARA